MTLNDRIIKWGAVLAAVVSIGGYGLAFGDVTRLRPALIGELQDGLQLVMDQTQKNTLALASQEFTRLEDKLIRGGELSWPEKRDFCTNALILDYPVSGSYGIACTNDGKPDLVTKVTP
jgi:hypothetical protein